MMTKETLRLSTQNRGKEKRIKIRGWYRKEN